VSCTHILYLLLVFISKILASSTNLVFKSIVLLLAAAMYFKADLHSQKVNLESLHMFFVKKYGFNDSLVYIILFKSSILIVYDGQR